MRKFITVALAGAALVACGGANAQPEAAARQAPADLTRAAAEARAAQAFARMDINKDGKLDAADRQARQSARFERLDSNKDGSVSQAEFAAQRERRADAPAERRGDRAQARGDRKAGHAGQMARGHGRFGGGMGPTADANKDGAVTQAEFASAALERFDRADSNKDGTISHDERRGQRPARRTAG